MSGNFGGVQKNLLKTPGFSENRRFSFAGGAEKPAEESEDNDDISSMHSKDYKFGSNFPRSRA